MNYKRAFTCKKCPGNNTSEGCPVWWEVTMANLQTGEEQLVKGCGHAMLPILIVQSVKAANRSSEASSQVRNTLLKIPEMLQNHRNKQIDDSTV